MRAVVCVVGLMLPVGLALCQPRPADVVFGDDPPVRSQPAVTTPSGPAGEASLVETGRRLFNDPILSGNGKVSCATCHDRTKGFTSGGLPPSLKGGKLARRAPTLNNVGNRKALFWDGRAKTLEEQALGPITHPDEMGADLETMTSQVSAKYGRRITPADVAKALAAYERTLTTPPTKVDAYLAGTGRLSAAEERGWAVFKGKGLCYKCHTGPDLTDDDLHATGHGDMVKDAGLYAITKDRRDRGKFRTPPLRNCKANAPYMHDAGLKTLADVVEFYDRGGVQRPGDTPAPNVSPWVRPLGLTTQEKQDLVALLEAL